MIAETLLDVAWKSALIAGAALAASRLLRNRPAAERATALRLGVLLVLSLPVLAVFAPSLRIELPVILDGPTLQVAEGVTGEQGSTTVSPSPALRGTGLDVLSALTVLYGIGAAALFARLVAGVWTLARWTQAASMIDDRAWRMALTRLAPRMRPRLRVSSQAKSPLSWGLGSGVILIDPATAARPERIDAVLAHETAHIRRGDWAFLLASQMLVAALWFNPLMWLLRSELLRQAEQAADAEAVRRVAVTDYAQVLLTMAGPAGPRVALGMAGRDSDMAQRVKAVLGVAPRSGRPWALLACAVTCIGCAAPLAAVDLTGKASPQLQAAAEPVGDREPVAAPQFAGQAAASAIVRAVGDVVVTDLTSGAYRIEADALSVEPATPNEPMPVLIGPAQTATFSPRPEAASDVRRRGETVQMRSEAAQWRAGAAEMEQGASQLDVVAQIGTRPDKAAEARTGGDDLRRQAQDMRSRADALSARADRLEAGD